MVREPNLNKKNTPQGKCEHSKGRGEAVKSRIHNYMYFPKEEHTVSQPMITEVFNSVIIDHNPVRQFFLFKLFTDTMFRFFFIVSIIFCLQCISQLKTNSFLYRNSRIWLRPQTKREERIKYNLRVSSVRLFF